MEKQNLTMMIHCSKANKHQKFKKDNLQVAVVEIMQALVVVEVVVVATNNPNKLQTMMHNCKLDKHNYSKLRIRYLLQLHKAHVALQEKLRAKVKDVAQARSKTTG